MNVVIYARYSSEKQTDQSIEGQLKCCYEYAKRNNYEVIGEYKDKAVSGKTDKREDFMKLLADSKNKQFQGVIVYSLDRFGRNLRQSIENEYKLQKNGVSLLSASENFADDSAGRMLRNMMMVYAQYYSDELAQKVRRGMEINVKKSLSTGGTTPFGYKLVKIDPDDEKSKKKLDIDEDTAPYVEEIYKMYANGDRIIDIITYLNSQQIKTASGVIFNRASLHRILSNEKYIGILKYGDFDPIPNGVPRIISDELFNKVAKALVKNRQYAGRSRARAEYLLTTKLFCGLCKKKHLDSPMVGVSGHSSSKKIYNYYSCNNTRTKPKLCEKKIVSKEYIEDYVVNTCCEILTNENIEKIAIEIVSACEREKSNSKLPILAKKLNQQLKKKTNLINSVGLCEIDDVKKTLFKEIDTIQKVCVELDKQIAIEQNKHCQLTIQEVRFFLKKLKKGDINNVKYRKAIINTFVSAVYLYDDRITFILNAGDRQVTIDDELFNEIENRCEPETEGFYTTRFSSPKLKAS